MLHLTLAGNLLTAVGGTPTLYARGVNEPYPRAMFLPQGEGLRIALGLEAACRQHIQVLQEARNIVLFELHFPKSSFCGNRLKRTSLGLAEMSPETDTKHTRWQQGRWHWQKGIRTLDPSTEA